MKCLEGMKFGKLTVLTRNLVTKKWECKCDCGNITFATTGSLNSGHRTSCGCYRNFDLTNLRFGKLIAIEFSDNKNKWLCHCDCGNKIYCHPCRLKKGHNKSCGCIKNINLIDKRFGKLVVTGGPINTNNKKIWQCKCDCGKTINVSTSVLRKQKSCGCSRAITIKNKMWTGCGEISGSFWGKIINGAKRRKIEVKITIENIWELFIKQQRKCALTKIELYFPKKWGDNSGTASLDRIDSNKGYTIDNIQWVHKDVNQMKMELKEDWFFKLCKLITENKCG